MRIVRSHEIEALAADVPADPAVLQPHWLEGPFNGERLDVGMITLSPGGVTPPHIHIGGQVMIVTGGRGFVEVHGHRHTIEQGDVVICAPGERHAHGALHDHHLSHLTITTGGYEL